MNSARALRAPSANGDSRPRGRDPSPNSALGLFDPGVTTFVKPPYPSPSRGEGNLAYLWLPLGSLGSGAFSPPSSMSWVKMSRRKPGASAVQGLTSIFGSGRSPLIL